MTRETPEAPKAPKKLPYQVDIEITITAVHRYNTMEVSEEIAREFTLQAARNSLRCYWKWLGRRTHTDIKILRSGLLGTLPKIPETPKISR